MLRRIRHTFAMRLLENDTDIRYIQELLGHGSILTIERYIHVARRGTLNTTSPLDNLMEGRIESFSHRVGCLDPNLNLRK